MIDTGRSKRERAKQGVLAECMEAYEVGDDKDAEWPNNLISRRAVVHSTGAIGKKGDRFQIRVEPKELALCERLSTEAAKIMGGVEVGMGSESGAFFEPFFIAAEIGAAVPSRIDEALIRKRFGGTIFPPATITVEPLKEAGTWWSEVKQDGAGSGSKYFLPWRRLIKWFASRKEFVDTAFVRIGDYEALTSLDEDDYPEGTEMPGSVMPRLALGLTRAGSLVGLFGYSVQT